MGFIIAFIAVDKHDYFYSVNLLQIYDFLKAIKKKLFMKSSRVLLRTGGRVLTKEIRLSHIKPMIKSSTTTKYYINM